MKHLLYSLLLVLCLSSCAADRAARRAERAAGKEALRVAALPPEERLAELVAQNPALVGKTTRVVEKIVTVRVTGETVTVTVPAASTPETDKALVDSLLRAASRQLQQADSAAYAARLRQLLASRPRLSRDTVRQQVGDLLVKAWVDNKGVVHVRSTSLERKVDVPTIIKEGVVQPIVRVEPGFWAKLWLALKAWFWLLIILLLLACFWIGRKLYQAR